MHGARSKPDGHRSLPVAVKLGWLAAALALAVTAACALELPSTRPLGTGPLAGKHGAAPLSAMPVARTGGADQDDDENAPSDEVTVVSADAGAADAQRSAAVDAAPQGQPAAGAALASFSGDFRGKDVNVLRPQGGAAEPPIEDPNSRITVSEERDKRLAFTLYGPGGSVACTLYATPSGATAQFAAGQECIGGKLARGTARIEGDTLTLELVLDIELTAGDQSVRATLEYRFEGRRKK